MLQLRPNCECCNRALPTDSQLALICSYECTFCRDCVERVLQNVCPNCGGGFMPRPVRPKNAYRPGVSLTQQPASTNAVHSRYCVEEMQTFSQKLASIPPAER
ncbi:DUF1272 domain-containing protein [Bowmanella sp. Y26]|uniref:DUF1272 domain-containing protein n=1 Tax=Bowmanella yangjiangensis TaxID=2811230 RepID=UPI001BDBF33D|nr:DUF1272 domain-containing protein [Bowmanella yangjiangensis]MBT1062032.1 DUF1272 domain-containing protein [Bowmanella yangjiangensis]